MRSRHKRAIDAELRGGRSSVGRGLGHGGVHAIPGTRSLHARLEAMDRDGVDAEVLYSEVSAFRSFNLVKGDWKPISRAFTDLMAISRRWIPTVSPSRTRCRSSTSTYAVDRGRTTRRPRRPVRCTSRTIPSEIGLPDYHEPLYDPLWAALQETGISSATISATATGSTTSTGATRHRRWPSSRRCPRSRWPRCSAWWILTGTLERFPGLQDRVRRAGPLLGPRVHLQASTARPTAAYDFPATEDQAERVLPPQHGVHLHGRHDRSRVASPGRRGEHPVVDRLPPPRDHLAELARDRRKQFAGIPDEERELICSGQRGPDLQPVARRRGEQAGASRRLWNDSLQLRDDLQF